IGFGKATGSVTWLDCYLSVQQPANVFAVIEGVLGKEAGENGIPMPPDTALVARFGNTGRSRPKRRPIGHARGNRGTRWPGHAEVTFPLGYSTVTLRNADAWTSWLGNAHGLAGDPVKLRDAGE